jgi:hypothetical protein
LLFGGDGDDQGHCLLVWGRWDGDRLGLLGSFCLGEVALPLPVPLDRRESNISPIPKGLGGNTPTLTSGYIAGQGDIRPDEGKPSSQDHAA